MRTTDRLATCALLAALPMLASHLTGCGGSSKLATRTPAAIPEPSLAARPEIYTQLKIVNGKPYPDMYFRHFGVNPTIDTAEESVSTFSIDVDTASYALARAYLQRGAVPEDAAVRVEEFINAFDYAYPPPNPARTDNPFAVHAEVYPSPNRRGYHVLSVGLKGREVSSERRKPANLVFVIDVSGSMNMGNRLGLVRHALGMLVDQLRGDDSVGIVVYGSTAHVVLDPTSGADKQSIKAGIDRLRPEGSTHAQAGIELGYALAAKTLKPEGINRIILCSDGVANNGITHADGIFDRVRRFAAQGIQISTVGFGMGNYNDVLLERLAQIGDGNYAYIDGKAEARRVFVEGLTGRLQVIAKDVKIQLELDRQAVARYRLLGYENRVLNRRDFDDDRVDAGEIGAGHQVTALYELKLRDGVAQSPTGPEFGTLRIRYKPPHARQSSLMVMGLPRSMVQTSMADASPQSRLALVAAAFAEKLRRSYWVRNLRYDQLLELLWALPEAWRQHPQVAELGRLIQIADGLDRREDRFERQMPLAQMDFDHVPILQ